MSVSGIKVGPFVLCTKHNLCCRKPKLTSQLSVMCVHKPQNVPTELKNIAGNTAEIRPLKFICKESASTIKSDTQQRLPVRMTQ